MSENLRANEFVCPCNAKIKSLTQLCRHVQYNHYETDDAGETVYYVCPSENCKNRRFKGPQNIKRHFERNHYLDVNYSCLFDEPPSANVQSAPSESNAVQNNEPLPDLSDLYDDASSDASIDHEGASTPVLLVNQQFNELRLEDKLCNLIIQHKKAFPGITSKACLDISEEYRKFYCDYLESGKLTFKI